jgi:hypothetical protein
MSWDFHGYKFLSIIAFYKPNSMQRDSQILSDWHPFVNVNRILIFHIEKGLHIGSVIAANQLSAGREAGFHRMEYNDSQ